ncbi:MAG: 3'-5' exonuclease [Bacteroidales bacterium]|nr:3'-5' exonuclease [Bacteroidales bacterium]
MLYQINFEKILFLDIETVPACPQYAEQPDKLKKLWDHKAKFLKKEEDQTPEDVYGQAGIYAEFGKIVCISSGFYKNNEFRIKSFFGDDETKLLEEFAGLLNNYYATQDSVLCAHNGKEFDYPYIARRMLINGLKLPGVLNIAGKKPWEVRHLDTMELWKFGDYKHYTSLDLLTYIFDIPTPKEDMDGSMVREVYYEEKNLQKIVDYCQKDTLAVAQLLLKYLGQPLIEENMVQVV